MERRKAITTAAAASLTLLAGAAGIALNSGIVGAGDDHVGQISPVTTSAVPIVVYADDPPRATPVTTTPFIQPTSTRPVTTSAASGYQDDHEDQEHEREHEHEGAEDDD